MRKQKKAVNTGLTALHLTVYVVVNPKTESRHLD